MDLSMHRFCLLSPSGTRKPIGSFLIFIITGVAAHPSPLDLMLCGHGQELLPQVPVQHWLPIGSAPPFHFPPRNVFAHALAQILGVSNDLDLTDSAERTQPLYRRGEFHSVIGCCGFASCEHAFRFTTSQNATPSARTGIADSPD